MAEYAPRRQGPPHPRRGCQRSAEPELGPAIPAARGIRTADGEPAHTACVAFGIDRLAVALFAQHGVEIGGWPEAVRARLGV